MRIPYILSSLLLLTLAGAARAQVAIHGAFNYTHDHDASANQTLSLFGGTVGLYDNFVHLGPVRAGLDLRGTFASGDKYHYRMVLAGPRVQVRVPLIGLKPYGEFLVGVGGTSSTGALAAGISSDPYNNKFTYEAVGGVDTTLLPHLDLRVIEIGYGRQTGVNGSANSNPQTTLVTVEAGLVLRF